MPRFHFDYHETGRVTRDEFGQEMQSVGAAHRMAMIALGEAVRDLPWLLVPAKSPLWSGMRPAFSCGSVPSLSRLKAGEPGGEKPLDRFRWCMLTVLQSGVVRPELKLTKRQRVGPPQLEAS
jgi:hypothetical protein